MPFAVGAFVGIISVRDTGLVQGHNPAPPENQVLRDATRSVQDFPDSDLVSLSIPVGQNSIRAKPIRVVTPSSGDRVIVTVIKYRATRNKRYIDVKAHIRENGHNRGRC